MNELDLFDALTFLDDELILEAHETPVRKPLRFRGLGRAAVIAAAVMMLLMMTAVAGDWDFKAEQIAQTYATEPNTSTIWVKDGVWYQADNDYFLRNGLEIGYVLSEVFSPQELQYYVFCEGESIRVTLEAMILMEDQRLEYKKVTSTQADQVSLIMDNYVNGEEGTIVHVRRTLEFPVYDEWVCLAYGYCYLPTQIGFEVPYGLDARFPDMRYNYDGRNSAVKEPE